ncbi:MAG: GNAT family N-acetyltransferase [Pirellulales bacterium]
MFSLTIADPDSDEYLGSCGVNPLEEPNELEVYFTVIPARQNKGYATEAMAALLEYLWNSTQTSRATAFVVPSNVASIRVAEKLGFVDMGDIERRAITGDRAHRQMNGRRLVLNRPVV